MSATSRPVRNISSFIEILRREKRLVVVDATVSPDQEIAEIHRRVIAAGGPALLFTSVKGSPHPVVTNLFGSRRCVDLAFGRRPQQFVADAVRAVHEAVPPTPAKLWPFRHLAMQALRIGMKRVREAPVLEVVEKPQLTQLPMLKLWPEDGGHFVTLPLVYTQHPQSGKHNLGMYRMQRYSDRETGIHWQIGKGGGFHHHEAERLGQALPSPSSLGGPPR